MSTEEILSGLPLWALLPNNAANGNIPVWNSTLGIWEAGTGGGFDIDADYSPTGAWDFTQTPTVGGADIALRSELSAYVTTSTDQSIGGNKTFSNIVTSTAGFAMRYATAPTGATNLTTMYADATGKLAWRNGTGFTRTFDAGAITANRSWTMPDADTTLAGLGVAQTFTANQTINANLAVGGTFTASARAHFRGDGTNAVARFDDNTGTRILEINQNGFFNISNASSFVGWFPIDNTLAVNKNGFGIGFTNVMQNGTSYYFTNALNKTATTGTSILFKTQETFAAAAGSANYRHLEYNYTINNSGAQSGTATGIFVNATQSNLNGMTHNLLDLQINSSSFFRVTNNGTIFSGGAIYNNSGQFGRVGFGFINFYVNGNALLQNASENDFNRLQLGGTTASFPALKRNAATLEARLADDSAYANFRANDITGNRLVANSTIVATASTTAIASLNIPSGVAPTTPTNGDIWFDGTDLYIRIAGANKRFTTTG